jgi:hypothetical protein
MDQDWIILYSCEKYFELLSEIKEALIMQNITKTTTSSVASKVTSPKNKKLKNKD